MDIRIKQILKEKGISVNELAERLGISRQALSKQLQGKMLIETAERIAKSIDAPLWQFFVDPQELKSSELVCPHCGKPISVTLS